MRYPLPEIYPRKTRGHISNTNSVDITDGFPSQRKTRERFVHPSADFHFLPCRPIPRKSRLHRKVNKDNGFAPVTIRYGASIPEQKYPVTFRYSVCASQLFVGFSFALSRSDSPRTCRRFYHKVSKPRLTPSASQHV